MKKLIFSALVLSLSITAVSAQEIPERKTDRPGMMHKKKHRSGMNELKDLNLTEDQKAKFKSTNEAFRKQMEELKKNDNITVKEWKAKAESIRKARKEEMQKILTTEQKAQLQKSKEERKVKSEDIHKRMAEKMKSNLNLTSEQSARLEANRKAIREEMKLLRENNTLSLQEKSEKMKELQKKQKESLKSILTEEQIQKLKESHKNREGRRHGVDKKKEI